MGQETRFTPGPWRVEQDTTLIWGCCNASDRSNYGMGYPFAECRTTPANPRWAKGPDYDEGVANAYLISAAPDMYEALEAVVSAHDRYLEALGPHQAAMAKDPLTDACEAARSAIAKAQGEQ